MAEFLLMRSTANRQNSYARPPRRTATDSGKRVSAGQGWSLLLLLLLWLCGPDPLAADSWRELDAIPDTLRLNRLECDLPRVPELIGLPDTTAAAACRDRLDRLTRAGWWNARFDSLVAQDGTGTAHFTPGRRLRLAELRLQPESGPIRVVAVNQPATETVVTEQLSDQLTANLAAGAAFSELRLEGVVVEQGRVALNWRMRGEEPVRLASQLVYGNQLTRPEVIDRLTRFQPGMNLNPLHWEKARLNLRRQIFVEAVEPFQLVRSGGDGEYATLIKLTEAPSYFFAGNLGYAAGEQNSGYWVWSVDIRLLNILGTARELYLRTDRTAPETRSISVRYREPFLLGSQLFLEPHLMQQDHDSTYHEREYGLVTGWRPSFTLALSLGLSRREVFPDSLHGWIEQGIRQERNTVWESELILDSRDDLLHPRRGFYARYGFLESRKQLRIPGDEESHGQRVVKQRLTTQLPWPLHRRWTLLLDQDAQLLQSDSTLSLPDLLRLGGTRSLRGYREEQFLVDRYLLGRSELQYHLGWGSDLHLFLDGAVMERRGNRWGNTGYGVGLKLRVRQGYLGVDYALPGGGSLGDGKLHLLYESVF